MTIILQILWCYNFVLNLFIYLFFSRSFSATKQGILPETCHFDIWALIYQMAERKQSHYVKLTKDQAPMEEIRPGELNQPIDVPQV